MTMPSKIPLERVGTIREGEIYLRADVDRHEGETFDVVHQSLKFIVTARNKVAPDEFDWFRIVRAFEQRGDSQ
jgi:hypothetical protein